MSNNTDHVVNEDITGRIVNSDITIMSIDGEDILALFREARLDVVISGEDVSLPDDEWIQRKQGQKDWQFACSKLIKMAPVFVGMALNGAFCVVQCDIGGIPFRGTGMIAGVTLATGDPQVEGVVVISARNAPAFG